MRLHHLHHIHQRKRVHQKLEPYPHTHPWINFLDRLLLVVAIIAPFTTLPQLYTIFIEKNVTGVSAITWLLYTVLTLPWIVYGFVHKEKPIIVSSLLWLVTDVLVVVGTMVYR